MNRRPLLVVLAALSFVLPACAKHDKTVDLGLRKVTLDLKFKGKGAAKSLSQIVTAEAPYAPVSQALGNALGPVDRGLSGINLSSLCPKAPAGLLPEVPVDGVPLKKPEAGVYVTKVEGGFDIQGTVKLKSQFFPIGQVEIANVTDEKGKDSLGQAMRTIGYDVIERNVLSSTTTHYQSITRDIARTNFGSQPQPIASELELVWTKTTPTGGKTTEFHPTPPISLMQYGGEGAEWTSAGIDPDTNEAMVVSGTIAKREAIDVCGTMIDTFRVESNERVVDQQRQYESHTNVPTVYNVATQFGGLVVRTVVDSTTQIVGGDASLDIKSTTTFTAIHPFAKSS